MKTCAVGKALQRITPFKTWKCMSVHTLVIRMISTSASVVLAKVFNPLVHWCPRVCTSVMASHLRRVD